MSTTASSTTTYLQDYQVPDFLISHINLKVDLGDTVTTVNSKMQLSKNPNTSRSANELFLHGESIQLESVCIDEQELSAEQYRLEEKGLRLLNVPEHFSLEIVNTLKPEENTALSGLYTAKNGYFTQCEAEGFRRITYYLDRPDVLAHFTTTIIAYKEKYPILLSNGNLIDAGDLDLGRHWVTWQDPFKKPSYLFALVAADLDQLSGEFTTQSGRKVALNFYVEKGYRDKSKHAMQCLQSAMTWDEKNYGREYDLDIYNVVSVSDFNMGAMENKGLNIFNSKYILADEKTATDYDYEMIEAVIGHEYFHNWTGNRVTCRDWFQLSLKEGLTIFREQEFCTDMSASAVKRIHDVKVLREQQFPEDSGPLSHSVQPDAYIEINNFYTMTIYHKGSELLRMIKTLIGGPCFRHGMDLYFSRHDGEAVTIEEFIKAMEDANQVDLQQFRRWYSQAGTPTLEIIDTYNEQAQSYQLKITQNLQHPFINKQNQPLYLPFVMGLLDPQGQPIACDYAEQHGATEFTLEIRDRVHTFVFNNVSSAPTPSFLRGFSAPVKIDYAWTEQQLLNLLQYDTDPFNRWEAMQLLFTKEVTELLRQQQQGEHLTLSGHFTKAFEFLLNVKLEDKRFHAELLTLPSIESYVKSLDSIDVAALIAVFTFIDTQLAQQFKQAWLNLYMQNAAYHETTSQTRAVAERALKNTCLLQLAKGGSNEVIDIAVAQYQSAVNMTDQIAALHALVEIDCPQRDKALADFYQQWQTEALVIEKWFALQAQSSAPGALQRVQNLCKHPAFIMTNPNKVRGLIGGFATRNFQHFHDAHGAGYDFLADKIIVLDRLNPQVAARLSEPFSHCWRYDPARQANMRKAMQRILKSADLSEDVYEIISKAYGD